VRSYLSYGGGVNSTAMYLLMLDQGVEFEAIYVDHDSDWPETRAYVKMFAERFPLTILRPMVQGHQSLFEYCKAYQMIPSRRRRWCTSKFKVRIINAYVEKPCFSLIGIDAGEKHRASISVEKGIENRYPLIENNVDRDGCKEIIKNHGLEIPMKSGCWFCPYQRKAQWQALRRKHPDLFCEAQKLEQRQIEARAEKGKGPIYLFAKDRPISSIIDEAQAAFPGMEEIEYPPCHCGL